MARKCYISFKTEDINYKLAVQDLEGLDIIDKSLDEPINSVDEDYIMRVIRRDYLADSTVTIHLIGLHGAEIRGAQEQKFIKRELQASLYDSADNSRSGILGIVLPEANDYIYRGKKYCYTCESSHSIVNITDSTTISEFRGNYYTEPHSKCAYDEDDRYCVLVSWDEFVSNPNVYIEAAFEKREHPIAKKVRVRP